LGLATSAFQLRGQESKSSDGANWVGDGRFDQARIVAAKAVPKNQALTTPSL
jgi:hypothetical protein